MPPSLTWRQNTATIPTAIGLRQSHLTLGRPKDAVETLDRGIARVGQEKELAILRFRALVNLGREAEAIEWMRPIVEEEPASERAFTVLADAFIRQMNWEDAGSASIKVSRGF